MASRRTPKIDRPDALKSGEIALLGPYEVQGLPASRLVRVYVPRGYDQAMAHRVLFLFDGQNVFDDAPSFAGGWHVHRAVERFARCGRRAPIVVGIDHGGDRRIDELSPFVTDRSAGRAGILIDWVADGLLPALGSVLHLVQGPEGIVMGGSSMGGLAALYAHFRRGDVFGGAMCMSPSFWFARGRIFRYVASRPLPKISKVYIDGGAHEGGGNILQLAERMVRHLTERGYNPTNLMWYPDPRGTHSERHWRRRFPRALRFLFS